MSRSVHPLLLEPSYWKNRLAALRSGPGSMLSSPREDLSGLGRRVEEFRMKAHDGQILWGLVSYPTFFKGLRPCRIKAAGPADPVELDPKAAETGVVEILYQVSAGRRLEDRVVDLLRIHAQAGRQVCVDRDKITIQRSEGDETWIAPELLQRLA